MAIAGAGAGINELTALAATSEMAPTSKRGKYVAVLVFTILPFAPSVLWAQLIASHAGWRYVGAFCGAWSGVGLLVTVCFYIPPPRVNSKGMDKMEVIKRIDFVGGLLSISGMIVFLAGLQWGGYQVCELPTVVQSLLATHTLGPVRMEHGTCPCAFDYWVRFARCLLLLGNLWNRLPNISITSQARASHPCSYSPHHVYLGLELFLRYYVLANASIQRLWPRSRWSWSSRTSYRIWYSRRCLYCFVAAQHFQGQ